MLVYAAVRDKNEKVSVLMVCYPSFYSRPVQFDEPRESLPQHQAQASIERKKKFTCSQLILSIINTFYYITLLLGPLQHYSCYR